MQMLKEQAAASGAQGAAIPQANAAPSRRKWPWIAAAAALLLLAGLLWRSSESHDNIAYTTSPVTAGPVTRAVTATGTVNPVLTIIVGSYISGPIQQLYCDYNAQVQEGQICAKIDPRPYQSVADQNKANLDVAKAQLEKDRSNLAYTKANYERLSNLARTQAVSQDQADNAKNTYNQALAQIAYDEAMIEQQQARLDSALVNLEYTNIVSPVSGTVVSRNVTMGQTVAASFQTPTLFLIATDLTKMQVDTNVSESDIGSITVGNRATFTVDAFPKRVFEGFVAQVRQSPQTVQNVVTYDVVISTDNADLALKPGLTAATRIVTAEREGVLRVPDQAFRYKPSRIGSRSGVPEHADGASVWVLRNGAPAPVAVKTGLDDDSFTEILAGLKPGDRVVIGERASSAPPKVPLPRL